MTLREATWRDVIRLWRWRNDPVTRRWSRNTERVGLVEHLRWFWRVQHSNRTAVYISTFAGRPVGTARLEKLDAWLGPEASVIIAPRWRGLGYGTATIRALTDKAQSMGIQQVQAVMHRKNVASQKAFRAAGFVPFAVSEDRQWLTDEWIGPKHGLREATA